MLINPITRFYSRAYSCVAFSNGSTHTVKCKWNNKKIVIKYNNISPLMYSRKKWMKQLGLFQIPGESLAYVCYLIKEMLRYLLSCSYNLIRFHQHYREKVYLLAFAKRCARRDRNMLRVKCSLINLIENQRLFLFDQLESCHED